MNIQKLVTNKTLTLNLLENDNLVDCAICDIGKPMIAIADLWWNSVSVIDFRISRLSLMLHLSFNFCDF